MKKLKGSLSRTLTPRELEVAQAITTGDQDSEIAKILGCAEATIARHLYHICNKLGYDNRTQVAVWVKDQEIEVLRRRLNEAH